MENVGRVGKADQALVNHAGCAVDGPTGFDPSRTVGLPSSVLPKQRTTPQRLIIKRKVPRKMLHISDGWYAEEGMCGI